MMTTVQAETGSTSRPVLEMRGLEREFTRKPVLAERALRLLGRQIDIPVLKAVRSVDLSVHEGEVLGLVGESGCGKSTLGRMLTGITSLSHGELDYDGKSVTELSG